MTISEEPRADAALGCLLSAPARPEHVARLRHELRDWLVRQSLPVALCEDVLMVANEAVTNVVQHAYTGTRPGPVVLSVRRDPDRVLVTVADNGRWRLATVTDGHGLHLIRSVARHVDIDTHIAGTTVSASLPAPSPGR